MAEKRLFPIFIVEIFHLNETVCILQAELLRKKIHYSNRILFFSFFKNNTLIYHLSSNTFRTSFKNYIKNDHIHRSGWSLILVVYSVTVYRCLAYGNIFWWYYHTCVNNFITHCMWVWKNTNISIFILLRHVKANTTVIDVNTWYVQIIRFYILTQ